MKISSCQVESLAQLSWVTLLFLDIEVDMKNDKKEDEEQSIENSMHKYGGHTSLHVHKINGLILPRDLQE